MKIRIISALVGIILTLTMLYISEINTIFLYLAISVATAIILSELLLAKGLFGHYAISVPTMLFGVLTPILSVTDLWFIPVYFYVLSTFLVTVFLHEKISYSQVAFIFAASAAVVLGMTSIVLACNLDEGVHPSFYAILSMGIPWLSDGGAYFTGTFLGKHKLCPKISPKKTVEGAIGGIVTGMVGAVLIGVVYSTFIYDAVSLHFPLLIMMGLINSIVAILGDLCFSIIKRSCHIKDYGTIMPGHGGLLDRFDSVILSAPMFFLISLYFPFFT